MKLLAAVVAITGFPLLAWAGAPSPAVTPAAVSTATPAAADAAPTPYVRTGHAEKRFDGWWYVQVPLGLPASSLGKLVPAMQAAAKARNLSAFPISGGVQITAGSSQVIRYWTQGTQTVDCLISFGVKGGDPATVDATEKKLLDLQQQLFDDAKARSEAAKAFE